MDYTGKKLKTISNIKNVSFKMNVLEEEEYVMPYFDK